MIRDPKGNELRLVLLQVMDRDARGPLTLRVRQDDEQIGLVSDPNPTFYMVWAATTSGLAETQLSDIVTELTSVKERQELVEKERLLLSRDVSRVTRELTTLETECAQKTEALRVLQKERDPEHVDRLVKDAVAHATKGLDDELRAARAREQRLGDQVTELQAAKKKLREALDRKKTAG